MKSKPTVRNRNHGTRRRLVSVATNIFAAAGYRSASVRQITRKARTNVASVKYHFGDKSGLYRAVFFLHFSDAFGRTTGALSQPTSFVEAYREYVFHVLATRNSATFQLMLAHEQLEPSGVLGDAWLEPLKRRHDYLRQALCRELNLAQPDTEIDRLAFLLSALPSLFTHGRHVLERLAPKLERNHQVPSTTVEMLTVYGVDLVAGERLRRSSLEAKHTQIRDE